MKKIFTLIAAVAVALSANALDFKVTAAAIAEGATLVDNDYVTVTTANNTATPTVIANEDGTPTPATYAGETFPCYVGVRVTDAPSAANPTGTVHDVNVALVFVAKQNTDVTLYYRIGATKSIDCYDQTTGASESIVQTATNPDDEYLYCTGVYKFQAGHTYTVYARGGTVQFHGLSAAAGTYEAPAAETYTVKEDCSGVIELTDIKASFLNNTSKGSNVGKGTWAFAAGSAKADQNACEIKFEPTKSGQLTIIFAAKVANNKSINMFVDGDIENTLSCKLTADDTELASGGCAAAGIAAGEGVYYYVHAGKTYNFYAAGTKYAVKGFSFDTSVPDGVAGVEASVEAAPAKAVKAVKGGRIVIIRADAEYSVSGAQLK